MSLKEKNLLLKIVGPYRIDLYLLNIILLLNVMKTDMLIEIKIMKLSVKIISKNILKCKFIRFNPGDCDFKVNKLLNTIHRKIVSSIKND